MKRIYQSIETIPAKMREELKAATHAHEAEAIFNAWENKGGYVERRSRGSVWFDA